MSEQPRDHASSERFIDRGNDSSQQQRLERISVSTEQRYGRPAELPPSSVSSPSSQQPLAGHGRAMELPPLLRAPSATGGSFPSVARSAGVSSILNPTEPDEDVHTRRRKVSLLKSPTPSMPILPPLTTSNQPYPPNQPTHDALPSSMTVLGSLNERHPRRILTPRSPSILHRAASLNQLNPPAATLNAQHSPFAVSSPRSRSYAIDPGSSAATPLPTPTVPVRQGNGFSMPTPHTQAARRASNGATRGVRPPSESTSPRSSYSSYSQPGQASPAGHPATTSVPGMSAPYPPGPEPLGGGSGAPTPGGSDRQRPIGVPISSSSGQNVYQMMTLETTSGTVQLPVDVQAASRVADEKRRRNAGASARFRQRRKEKEKESSSTISRLEQQVKELSEDSDFYKRERDYLTGVILQVPGGDRHFPRPQSPRHRRTTTPSESSGTANTGYISVHEGAQSPQEGRNVRRRTSTMSLPPPAQQAPQAPQVPPGPGLGSYPPSYPSQTYGQQPLVPQSQQPSSQYQGPGPQTLPSPLHRSSLSGHQPSGRPQLMQADPSTGPWNPYADRRPLGGPPPPHPGHQNRESH